jgi:hypothetical protein
VPESPLTVFLLVSGFLTVGVVAFAKLRKPARARPSA